MARTCAVCRLRWAPVCHHGVNNGTVQYGVQRGVGCSSSLRLSQSSHHNNNKKSTQTHRTNKPDNNTRPKTTPSTRIMKFTFTSMTMVCAMGLLSSAFLETAMSAEVAEEALKNVTVPVLNATMYPANVSLGSSVSASTVVGAPARAEPLSSFFAYFMLCCLCANVRDVRVCMMCVRERERERRVLFRTSLPSQTSPSPRG